ncbi:MAG: stalk domain-containing protein [Armatimonadota bacterium]
MRDHVSTPRRAAPWVLTALLALTGTTDALAQRGRVEVPANTVVRAELTQSVNSRSVRQGDRVVAELSRDDTSDFPEGTRFEGTITEVRRASDDRPAILDMEFRRAILPGGQTVNIRGDLASLSEDNVRQRDDGRLESRRRGGGSGFDWKWVGYGAGGGAVLGEIFGDNFLRGALLGGLGGAIYGYLNRDRDRGEFREVELPRGTEFGIRLDRQVAFNPGANYVASRERNWERVLGTRQETGRRASRLFIDDRPVTFRDMQPLRINGGAYVPLREVAREAGWTYRHSYGADDFSVRTPQGEVRGSVGERSFRRGGSSMTLTDAPVLVGDEVYVPVEFLGRIGDQRVRWGRS